MDGHFHARGHPEAKWSLTCSFPSRRSLFPSPPIPTSSPVKSHRSNRPREYFASPKLFVEIMNCVLSRLKPAVAALSEGSLRPTASTGDGWERTTGGKYAEQTSRESVIVPHPKAFQFWGHPFCSRCLFQLLCVPVEPGTDAASSLAALVYTVM